MRRQTLCTLRTLWDWCGSSKPQCDLWPRAVQPQWEAASTLSRLPDGWQSRNSLYSSLPASGTSLHLYSLEKRLAPGYRDKQWEVTPPSASSYRINFFQCKWSENSWLHWLNISASYLSVCTVDWWTHLHFLWTEERTFWTQHHFNFATKITYALTINVPFSFFLVECRFCDISCATTWPQQSHHIPHTIMFHAISYKSGFKVHWRLFHWLRSTLEGE